MCAKLVVCRFLLWCDADLRGCVANVVRIVGYPPFRTACPPDRLFRVGDLSRCIVYTNKFGDGTTVYAAYTNGYTQYFRVARILAIFALVVDKRDAGGGYGRAVGIFYRCA